MDYLAIFALITRGLTIVQTLMEEGQQATPAIKALLALVTNAEHNTVTNDQLTQTEALLDQMIADFNEELPNESSPQS